MEIYYCFDCKFPAVFLVNGVFFERLDRLKSDDSDSLYVTTLPLDALCLPYTVRIGGGEVFTNRTLCTVYRLQKRRYYVRLLPRYNYVYSPVKHELRDERESAPVRLFRALAERDIKAARELMSRELSASIDDNSLLAFFDGYADIVPNDGYVQSAPDTFFLIPDDPESWAVMLKAEYQNSTLSNLLFL